MIIDLSNRERATVVAALKAWDTQIASGKAIHPDLTRLAAIDNEVEPLTRSESRHLTLRLAEGEPPLIGIVRIDLSRWYSIRRVVRMDGSIWSVHWAHPQAVKAEKRAREIARPMGRILPGIFTTGERANQLVPIIAQ